ncbi:MAG: hypothetical protein AB7I30_21650, partial [Isosphaeraceae bacterium]
MRISVALLALILAGAGGPVASPPSQISYQFQLIDTDGLDWRSELHPRLTTVKREGAFTVWTSTQAVSSSFQTAAHRSIMAPKVTAFENVPAHVSTKK